MRNQKDLSSKWILEHHGDSIFRLANLPEVESWRPEPPENILPRRIPDGLFSVKFRQQPVETPVLVEIESEPNLDADRQMLEDILLVRLDRGLFPDAILVLLKPRGNASVAGHAELISPASTVRGQIHWRVIRLWELQAEDLFALNDAGLVPWITLTQTTQPPDEFLERCRALVDQQVPEAEQEEFLVVTSIFAGIRYNNFEVISRFFRGKNKMLESSTLKYFKELGAIEMLQKAIVRRLKTRFGEVPADLFDKVNEITNEEHLDALIDQAASCKDLEAFRAAL